VNSAAAFGADEPPLADKRGCIHKINYLDPEFRDCRYPRLAANVHVVPPVKRTAERISAGQFR